MQTFFKHLVDKIAKYQHYNLPNFDKILINVDSVTIF